MAQHDFRCCVLFVSTVLSDFNYLYDFIVKYEAYWRFYMHEAVLEKNEKYKYIFNPFIW